MRGCPWGCYGAGPDWDHYDSCPYWPGSEWARRHGHMENCGGLVDCDVIHPYEPFDLCECMGQCHYCSHIGCERCIEKAYRDLPWWRKLFQRFRYVAEH